MELYLNFINNRLQRLADATALSSSADPASLGDAVQQEMGEGMALMRMAQMQKNEKVKKHLTQIKAKI